MYVITGWHATHPECATSMFVNVVSAVQALERLADFLQSASNVTVLTGAGVSTGRRKNKALYT
jgi:major membrane immunogen (membrane-anchored lipoprotein)